MPPGQVAGPEAGDGHPGHQQPVADQQADHGDHLAPDPGVEEDQRRRQVAEGDPLEDAGDPDRPAIPPSVSRSWTSRQESRKNGNLFRNSPRAKITSDRRKILPMHRPAARPGRPAASRGRR